VLTQYMSILQVTCSTLSRSAF